MHDAIRNTVDRVIWRLLARRVSVAVWRCGLGGGLAALACLLVLDRADAAPDAARWSLGLWVVGVALGLALGFRKSLRPYEAAKFIDDALGLNDRVSSAYSFLARGETGGFAQLAIQDAAAATQAIRPSKAVPSPSWGRLAISLCVLPIVVVITQRQLFPPPPVRQVEVFSEEELGAALSAIDMAIEDPQAFQELQQELKKLGVGETTEKGELLARLNRTIADLKQQAESDDGVLTTLAQMEKLKSKLGLAELQMRADEELRHVEQLVTDEGVLAETIFVDPLVDQARAKKVAEGLKAVAQQQLAGQEGVDTPEGVGEEDPAAGGTERETDAGAEEPGGDGGTQTSAGPADSAEQLALRALSDQAIRERILKAARQADRASEDYVTVYRNYRRAFLAELFRTNLGSGRREYLERYFHTIRPEGK